MKLLNTLWVGTTNALTLGILAGILYAAMGGVITAGQDPTPTCYTYKGAETCIVR